EPDLGRRQHLSAARADGARTYRDTGAAHRGLRALQRDRLSRRRAWRAGGVRPRLHRRGVAGWEGRCDPGDVRRLCAAWRGLAMAVPAALRRDRSARYDTASPARPVEADRLWPRRAIRDGFVRHRLSGAVAAGAVALPTVSDIGDDRRRDLVLERHLLCGVVPDRGADRA